jgi:hypothetical protein
MVGTKKVCPSHQVEGEDRRDRTANLLHAIRALSQISYSPQGEKSLDCRLTVLSKR